MAGLYFHATSVTSALSICATNELHSGWDGLVGPAIYLAKNRPAAIRKARGEVTAVVHVRVHCNSFLPELNQGDDIGFSPWEAVKVARQDCFAFCSMQNTNDFAFHEEEVTLQVEGWSYVTASGTASAFGSGKRNKGNKGNGKRMRGAPY